MLSSLLNKRTLTIYIYWSVGFPTTMFTWEMTRNPARVFLCEMVSTNRAGNEGNVVTVKTWTWTWIWGERVGQITDLTELTWTYTSDGISRKLCYHSLVRYGYNVWWLYYWWITWLVNKTLTNECNYKWERTLDGEDWSFYPKPRNKRRYRNQAQKTNHLNPIRRVKPPIEVTCACGP